MDCSAERQAGRRVAELSMLLSEIGHGMKLEVPDRWYVNMADAIVMDVGVEACAEMIAEIGRDRAQFMLGASWMYLKEKGVEEILAKKEFEAVMAV